MNRYKITLERKDDCTWGQYDIEAPDAAQAMRIAARNLDLDDARTVTICLMDND